VRLSSFLPPGLPDVTVSDQNSQFGYISEGLGMEKVDMFYCLFEYFTVIWYILSQLHEFCCHLVILIPVWVILFLFWYAAPKILAALFATSSTGKITASQIH
jgi:hypothetical protein